MPGIFFGLILLAVLIVVHELGHFLVAKLMGVRVLTFSIGFGPKIFAFKKGHTEYRLSLIPLGGYVRMLGDDPQAELTEEEKKEGFLTQPYWKKSFIALAGPLFNFIFPVLIFFALFVGPEQVLLPFVGKVMDDTPAQIAGLRSGDKIVSAAGEPTKTFDALVKIISERPGQPTELQIERQENGQTAALTINLTPDSSPHPHPLMKDKKIGRMGIMPMIAKAQVVLLSPKGSAAQAGFQNFDEVVSVNKTPVTSLGHFERLIKNQKLPLQIKVARKDVAETVSLVLSGRARDKLVAPFSRDTFRYAVTQDELAETKYLALVSKTRQASQKNLKKLDLGYGLSFSDGAFTGTNEGSPAAFLGLKRGDVLLALNGKAIGGWYQAHEQFAAAPDQIFVAGVLSKSRISIRIFRLNLGGEGKAASTFAKQKYEFGETRPESYLPGIIEEKYVGVFEAAQRSVTQTAQMASMIVLSFVQLFKGEVPLEELSGPIGIFGVAKDAAAQGFAFYVFIMALISLHLGMINLLPIPVLDGGHLMIFTIEAIRGKPLSLKVRSAVTQVGFLFILSLMIFAIFNDVTKMMG